MYGNINNSFDRVNRPTPSGNLPLYFVILSIIIVLSFLANKFSLI